jgi:hypothetical protein
LLEDEDVLETFARVKKHLVESGLHINNVLKDWQNNLFDENSSREMIFSVGHA